MTNYEKLSDREEAINFFSALSFSCLFCNYRSNCQEPYKCHDGIKEFLESEDEPFDEYD